MEIPKRNDLFEETSEILKKVDKKYAEALKYFKNNWLSTYYVESIKIDENEDSSLIARTNNVCEYYNYTLNQKTKIIKPRLSVLVSLLLDEEFSIREFITKSTLNIAAEPPIPNGFTVLENQLPIGALSKLLEKKK